MMDQWGSGNRKSSSASSMTSSNSNGSSGSGNSVKLIKEKSDKLIIEGRPKLSVTKVSRLDGNSQDSSAKSKQGQTSSSPSPFLPKFKLSTNSMSSSESKKANDTETGGDKRNVSYSGKLKIKLGGGNTTIQSEKSSSDRSTNANNDITTGPEGGTGLAFSFAGKPTYSPSRIEPSNSSGTTVQTKGVFQVFGKVFQIRDIKYPKEICEGTKNIFFQSRFLQNF